MHEPILEALADVEHASWSRWMHYLFTLSQENDDGTVTIPAWAVQLWQRQLATPYAKLSEAEKQTNRAEVRRFLAVLYRIFEEMSKS